MQTLATMTTIRAWGREAPSPGKRADALRQRVCERGPHVRLGLQAASLPLRRRGGCDPMINEVYLFHGLGDPSKARENVPSPPRTFPL